MIIFEPVIRSKCIFSCVALLYFLYIYRHYLQSLLLLFSIYIMVAFFTAVQGCDATMPQQRPDAGTIKFYLLSNLLWYKYRLINYNCIGLQKSHAGRPVINKGCRKHGLHLSKIITCNAGLKNI